MINVPTLNVTASMVWIPGGSFSMGSNDHYPEESPRHNVQVDGFWIDASPVTNAAFACFIEATGYITEAEKAPHIESYPGADPETCLAGSIVFSATTRAVDLNNAQQWWRFMPNAFWRHPRGVDCQLHTIANHPVVHIAYADACAYVQWAGKQLPTEAEWEYAATGGECEPQYPMGAALMISKPHANIWLGEFPWQNLSEHSATGTSPVGTYPANQFGLYDMIGNVWEWTDDFYQPTHASKATHSCCVPKNPRGALAQASIDPLMPDIPIPRKVLKGGSHLCAPNYCSRYRPSARIAQPIDTATSHVGLRCVVRN